MIAFTAFYADLPDRPSCVDEFLRLMLAGERALKATNRNARYVALTDRRTAPLLEGKIEIAVTAPDDAPLMIKALQSQIGFERSCRDDMSVLAAPDCVPARDLSGAFSPFGGFAVTYVSEHWRIHRQVKINNVGYVRDHDLAAWFLSRALTILEGWPREKQDWRGDQESWQAALGPVRDFCGLPIVGPASDGRTLTLFPTTTHNCFVPRDGRRKRSHEAAYLLHFKAGRKAFMEDYVSAYLIGGAA